MTTDGDPEHTHPQHEVAPTRSVQIGDVEIGLTLIDLICVARDRNQVAPLTAAIKDRIKASADWVDGVVKLVTEQGQKQGNGHIDAYYGINTGFGALAGKTALSDPALIQVLSRNLITSHSIGVGAYFEEEIVRAAMLLRAHSLAQGYSGVRIEVVQTLIQALNKRVYPAIPSKGSLGASGDLAPLSHLALALSRPPTSQPHPGSGAEPIQLDPTSGEAFVPLTEPLDDSDFHRESREGGDGVGVENQPFHHITEHRTTGRQTLWRRVSGAQAMTKAQIPPLTLGAKEGLAFNNGATFSAALAALTLVDALNVFDHAELALALSLEGMRGFRDPFLPAIHRVRGHEGAKDTAARVLQYVAESSLLDGDATHDPKRIPPQDPYSLRCAPQVLGSILETLRFVRHTVEVEINAVTDNPLIFLEKSDLDRAYGAVSGGNFHGEPLALAMDFLGIAMTELGNIAERRVFKMTDYHVPPDPPDEYDLPDFLLDEPKEQKGLSSGYMIAQYTAASLISDCKTLAHPDSVDSIPSSANKEDHVSMSLNAARHAREIVDNVEAVIAIELMCAVQAIDLQLRRNPSLKPGRATGVVRARIREQVSYLAQDRVLYPDLRALIRLIRSGSLVKAARAAGNATA
ncbi:MAG TPA: histidine ammonia-lyase [Ktedonobacterales bacterium]|nr:histidine ammonia-lyase [Ktedonobacterales bacterium]